MIWLPPHPHPSLERRQIHVWQARLDQAFDRLPAYVRFLSEDEMARADRFHFSEHRRDFIVGRAFLRTVLGSYLGIDGERVSFEYTAYGKPHIAGEERRHGLFFNLTHSHHIALLAVTLESELGIDVEYTRPVDDGIPERYFSPSEVSALRALPQGLQQEAFFNCWTRKEAYIKSLGDGLSLALDSFDVSLEPGAPAAILKIRNSAEQASAWTMVHLTPAEGYVGALAIRARDCSVGLWKFDPL